MQFTRTADEKTLMIWSHHTYTEKATFSAQIILRMASITAHGRRTGSRGMLFPPFSAYQILHWRQRYALFVINNLFKRKLFLSCDCFLIRWNRTKRANFRCNHLFQATYNNRTGSLYHNYLINSSSLTFLRKFTLQYFHEKVQVKSECGIYALWLKELVSD